MSTQIAVDTTLVANQEINLHDRNALSDLVIPSEPGVCYAYSSEFTEERPFYVFLKCKANKARSLKTLQKLGNEAKLLFQFDNLNQAKVYTIKSAFANGLLNNNTSRHLFDRTSIAPANITADDFYKIHSEKDATRLIEICERACIKHGSFVYVNTGKVVAVMTEDNKYCLFCVRQVNQTSIIIDACHILSIL